MQRVLANRHYLINDSNAAAQHADFLAEIKAMLIGDRRSAMAPASVKKIQTAYDDYKDCNEPTFLAQSLPALLKDGRIPKTNDGAILESRLWSEDRVAIIQDQLFFARCSPTIEAKGKLEEKLFSEIPKVPNPKPDYCYGFFEKLKQGWCSADQHSVIQRFAVFTMVCPNIVLPWLVFEGKSAGGSLAKALVQATRAGATLVEAFRSLDKEAGTSPKGNGPDRRSIAFSMTISPWYASLNVHWADVENGKVRNYHVHGLCRYLVEDSDQWKNMRRDIHNVLDWGVLNRKPMIMEAVDRIVRRGNGEADTADNMDTAEDDGGAGAAGGEPAAKKAKTGTPQKGGRK